MAGADHHRQQHRVQHDAGAQTDQVQQLADAHGAHGTPRTGRLEREVNGRLIQANRRSLLPMSGQPAIEWGQSGQGIPPIPDHRPLIGVCDRPLDTAWRFR